MDRGVIRRDEATRRDEGRHRTLSEKAGLTVDVDDRVRSIIERVL